MRLMHKNYLFRLRKRCIGLKYLFFNWLAGPVKIYQFQCHEQCCHHLPDHPCGWTVKTLALLHTLHPSLFLFHCLSHNLTSVSVEDLQSLRCLQKSQSLLGLITIHSSHGLCHLPGREVKWVCLCFLML